MQEYFFTQNCPHLFITHVYTTQFNFTQLTYVVKWRSIKVNVRFSLINILRCQTFSSVRACFRPTTTWLSFRCWPTLINPFTDCFYWAKLPTLFWKVCNNCSVSNTKFPQCLDPSFIFVRYFTHKQSYRPSCNYDLKYWRIYYNTMLHVRKHKNNDVTTKVVLVAQLL